MEKKQKDCWKPLFSHIDGSQIEKLAFPKHGVNRTVVHNHLGNISGKFEPCIYSSFKEKEKKLIFFIRNRSFWPQNVWRLIFLAEVNEKVVGNVKSYLHMNFQPIIATRFQEKAQRPHFLTKNCLWKKFGILFWKSGFVTFLHLQWANFMCES